MIDRSHERSFRTLVVSSRNMETRCQGHESRDGSRGRGAVRLSTVAVALGNADAISWIDADLGVLLILSNMYPPNRPSSRPRKR